jgi:glycosyltransferase involved in cell wall biosynthesis
VEDRRAPLAVVVLTLNEEANLPACLASLRGLEHQLYVVDSGSTDATLEIARAGGARILQHPFESHAAQWQWALTNLAPRPRWILGLDADQRLTPELRQELSRLFTERPSRLQGRAGFYVKRRQIFRGRWIRHGGYYPKYLLKLFLSTEVTIDVRELIDHHFYVSGHTGSLLFDIIEDNKKEYDINFWIDKHNRYAALHAREELVRRDEPAAARPIRPSPLGTPDQRSLWLKQRWYRLPIYLRPALYFFYRYVLRLGFLDGQQGFVFHFLQGFWYRLLIDVHLDQLLAARRAGAEVSRPEGLEAYPQRAVT